MRHVLLGMARLRLDSVVDDFDNQRTLGEELLTPTRTMPDRLDLMVETDVHALAHITGGGIPQPGAGPIVLWTRPDRASWRPQPIFDLVQRRGRIDLSEMESTFNMGVGMMAVVAAHDTERALAFLRGRGLDAWVVGEVIDGTGEVQLVGSHTSG